MKKFLIIFGVFITPLYAFATAGMVITNDKIALLNDDYVGNKFKIQFHDTPYKGYMFRDNCKLINKNGKRANEYLYTTNSATGFAYEASKKYCPDKTEICVLGYSTVKSPNTKQNLCYRADVPRIGGDAWQITQLGMAHHSNKDCEGSPWTPKSRNKIPVFVNTQGKILITMTTVNGKKIKHPVQSLIGTDIKNDYDLECIAYVCQDQKTNEFTYGCPNGSCDDDCSAPDPQPAPDLSDPTVFDDPTPSSPSDPSTPDDSSTSPENQQEKTTYEYTTTPIHKKTCKPYLDALSKCVTSETK